MAGLSEYEKMIVKSEEKRARHSKYCRICGKEILNFSTEQYAWESEHGVHYECAKRRADTSQEAKDYEKWLAENTPKADKEKK